MIVPVKNGAPVIVPPAALRRAGFKNGEYTPAQRAKIDAELAEAAKGPFHGPFDTMAEMIEHLQGQLKP